MILLPSVLSLFLFLFTKKAAGYETQPFSSRTALCNSSPRNPISQKYKIYCLNTPCKSFKDDQILLLYRYFDLHKPNQADRNCFSRITNFEKVRRTTRNENATHAYHSPVKNNAILYNNNNNNNTLFHPIIYKK